MESGERKKNQQQLDLNRRHRAEWNAQLAQEMRDRLVLEEQYKQESARSYLQEINVHDRALLEAQQRQSMYESVQQNRLNRINLLKRHTQENQALN